MHGWCGLNVLNHNFLLNYTLNIFSHIHRTAFYPRYQVIKRLSFYVLVFGGLSYH